MEFLISTKGFSSSMQFFVVVRVGDKLNRGSDKYIGIGDPVICIGDPVCHIGE